MLGPATRTRVSAAITAATVAAAVVAVSASQAHVVPPVTRGLVGAASGNATGYEQISTGYRHSCAVTKAGRALCWGENADGQSTVPVGTFTQISAGGYHTCALTTAGEAVCWGSNLHAQSTVPAGT